MADDALVLSNDALAWHLSWAGGRLLSTRLENRLTGRAFALAGAEELVLVLSAALDRVQAPLRRVADFRVVGAPQPGDERVSFRLLSPSSGLEAVLHYALDGATRRKWVEVHNPTDAEVLLLDLELDGFEIDAPATGGGFGEPLFVVGEAFAAVEYPSGENTSEAGRLRLRHFPGQRLQSGDTLTSQAALISVTPAGEAEPGFVRYLDARSVRRKAVLSVYTPFGINNQWGPCPTLDDKQTLDVLDLLGRWQRQGVQFDCFTLDTGWADPSSDLKTFRPNAYPTGPERVVRRMAELGMRFGLWFATSWAAESCWDYPPASAGQSLPAMGYLNGCPDKAGYNGSFCFGCDAYVETVREAILHHVREHGVRFIKLDGGSYACDNPDHGHLPGRYATERMYGHLIELARAARELAPDVFVMWYWGMRSPFWTLHGDTVFESGLFMEGSGTSSTPTLHYRDSVTLAQDQNAQNARLIPPLAKDSLGVWLADTRWGNFMGRERWREALVMDLGRGSLLFPNLWGDLYLLDDSDVCFLARMTKLAKRHEALLLDRHTILGDPARSEVYGYAYGQGDLGFLFLNNPAFAARPAELRLDESLGLAAADGARLELLTHFPDRRRLRREDGTAYRFGDTLRLWLRPFEVLMVEVKAAGRGSRLPVRAITDAEAATLGSRLELAEIAPDPGLAAPFTEAARFQAQGLEPSAGWFAGRLPATLGPRPILAVVVRLRRGEAEWRYSPVVAEVVQVRVRVGGQSLQLMPVPDARQFGNTQKAGCSWVVYKVRLDPARAGSAIRLAVHAWLPPDVEAVTEAWVTERWWQESARPVGDGYYGASPS